MYEDTSDELVSRAFILRVTNKLKPMMRFDIACLTLNVLWLLNTGLDFWQVFSDSGEMPDLSKVVPVVLVFVAMQIDLQITKSYNSQESSDSSVKNYNRALIGLFMLLSLASVECLI